MTVIYLIALIASIWYLFIQAIKIPAMISRIGAVSFTWGFWSWLTFVVIVAAFSLYGLGVGR